MERKVKNEIGLMLVPVIGVWWVIRRILPGLGEITWWDVSNKALPLVLGLVAYQIICLVGWKVFYMMYFFDYEFEQVFTQW